jgi:hypothetical protein
VQVEMELVRPPRGHEEMGELPCTRIQYLTADLQGNFMLALELRSARSPDTTLMSASQPVSLFSTRADNSRCHLPPFLRPFSISLRSPRIFSHLASSLTPSARFAPPAFSALLIRHPQISSREDVKPRFLVRPKAKRWSC